MHYITVAYSTALCEEEEEEEKEKEGGEGEGGVRQMF